MAGDDTAEAFSGVALLVGAHPEDNALFAAACDSSGSPKWPGMPSVRAARYPGKLHPRTLSQTAIVTGCHRGGHPLPA